MAAAFAGRPARRRFGIDQNHDINVTPFVDVMLVLLIVFMVAAPLATTALKIDVVVPDGRPSGMRQALVTIDAAGQIHLGASPAIDIQDLPKALAAEGASSSTPIVLAADQRLRYGRFVAVLDQLQRDGFYKVSLMPTLPQT
jgi:biopolymer transport protein ExbD